ncbi:MAG TPA: L-threonylcarbamoyladenylate synthase [Bacteroidota bacterium]|jgi:L-threonylcarbamoyladenylate synthase|nr:L-threonylcarbamoyladenylate synthase [Bacteroidota bacterium]
MKTGTKILDVSAGDIRLHIAVAAEVLLKGGLVAFPTETVYGLGADASNAGAVEKVFEVKGRPSDNPLIVHIADVAQMYDIARAVPEKARRLAETFWPGPLTLVVEHRGQIPAIVTAGLRTVAVRIPNHPVTLKLISALGRGIVGPSANISGKPSSTTAQHVFDDLKGKIDIIIDAGPTIIGVESTVLDVTSDPPCILRPGGLDRKKIESIIGHVRTAASADELLRSPGTRHRHYAPAARVELLPEGDAQQLMASVESYRKQRKSIGCIVHSLDTSGLQAEEIQRIRIEEYAQRLFELLRWFDERRVDVIVVESIPETGIGEAVMDRLRKAAERK